MTGLRGKFETPTQFYPRYGYGIRVVDRWFTVCCRPWHFRACQPLFCESVSVSENSRGYVMGLKAEIVRLLREAGGLKGPGPGQRPVGDSDADSDGED